MCEEVHDTAETLCSRIGIPVLVRPYFSLIRASSVFSTRDENLSYIVRMLVNLKLSRAYDGLLYLADSTRNLQEIQSHHHNELELNLVLRGTITYVVDGRRFTFLPQTLLWLFPRQEHQLVDRSDDAQFYVAVFKPSLIRRSCKTELYQELRESRKKQDGVLNTQLNPEVFVLMRSILDSLMQGALDSELLNREAGFGPVSTFCFEHNDPDTLNAGLHYLLLLAWRLQLTGKPVRDVVSLHPAVRRALAQLTKEESETTLEELARACGASKSYLSRMFHRQIGVPINRYRNSLKLSRFVEIYKHSDQKTLTEAVYEAGFGSYAQFYKVFKQTYGQGPRDAMRPGDI